MICARSGGVPIRDGTSPSPDSRVRVESRVQTRLGLDSKIQGLGFLAVESDLGEIWTKFEHNLGEFWVKFGQKSLQNKSGKILSFFTRISPRFHLNFAGISGLDQDSTTKSAGPGRVLLDSRVSPGLGQDSTRSQKTDSFHPYGKG